jgi:hypothetical protein
MIRAGQASGSTRVSPSSWTTSTPAPLDVDGTIGIGRAESAELAAPGLLVGAPPAVLDLRSQAALDESAGRDALSKQHDGKAELMWYHADTVMAWP